MKRDFFNGVIVGIICTCILYGGTYFVVRNYPVKNSVQQTSDNPVYMEDTGIGDIISSSEFKEKYENISKLVNYYYLDRDDIDVNKVQNGIYQGMIDSIGDKYADYYDADEYMKLNEKTEGQYGGVGTYVTQEKDTGNLIIVNPFKEGPAYRVGIKSGDILTMIDGKSVKGLKLDEVVDMMKGDKGTKVVFGVIRDGERLSFEIEREIIDIPTVDYEILKDDNVGYIYISSFNKITGSQFGEAVDELCRKNVRGIIIDLRNNGGGVLDSAIEILDRILPEGLVMYTETNRGRENEYYSTAEKSLDIPYALIINQYSASASEVVAGAVQDYGLGTLVGTTSYGKGVVQSVISVKGFSENSALKLTTAKYFTPNGRNIDGIGIEPDIIVEIDAEKSVKKSDYTVDNQIQAAIEALGPSPADGNH